MTVACACIAVRVFVQSTYTKTRTPKGPPMRDLEIRTVDPTVPGGVDVVFPLSPDDVRALGADLWPLSDYLHTVLWGLVQLRSGEATPEGLYDVINHVSTRLLPRLEALRDVAVREHHRAGGSLSQLATAMDCPRSTAQARREVVLGRDPEDTGFETWVLPVGPRGEDR